MPDSEHEDLAKQLEQLGVDVLAGFVAGLADDDHVIEERVEERPTRAALGEHGPSHDVCPPGCCPRE